MILSFAHGREISQIANDPQLACLRPLEADGSGANVQAGTGAKLIVLTNSFIIGLIGFIQMLEWDTPCILTLSGLGLFTLLCRALAFEYAL